MTPVVSETGFGLMSCLSLTLIPSILTCSVDENAGAGAVIACALMDVFQVNQFAFDSASSSAVTSGA